MAELAPNSEAADRRPLKSRSYGWVRRLAAALVRAGVSPNGISVFGVVLAMVGFAVLWAVARAWMPGLLGLIVAAVCVQGRLMCNMMDGLVAVEGGRKSKGGDLFNEIPDRIEDSLFLAGAGFACGNVALGLVAALLAVFTAYVRAFGASLGQGQDFCGPLAKPQRMFFLTVGLLAAAAGSLCHFRGNILAWMLAFIAAGTAVTAARRIVRTYRRSS
jgi:phosphatidylglycerophosphate synthase